MPGGIARNVYKIDTRDGGYTYQMNRYHFECSSYVWNVDIRVEGQEKLDYIRRSFSC